MKKIAIIDHVGQKAGMDYYSSSLAAGLVQSDCSVSIYSNFTDMHSTAVQYHSFYDGHTNGNMVIKLFKFILATLKSSFFARKDKSDLVIVHLFSANFPTLLLLVIPKLFGLKTAVISHDVSSFIDNDSGLIKHLIYNVLSDHIIVHNKFSYDELMKSIQINNPIKICIIKQGGYIQNIKTMRNKAEARQQLGLDINGKYILFFGQIKKVKGLDVLLKAMSKVPDDIKLIIAGKTWNDTFSKYDDLIKQYNLEERVLKRIRFIEDDERENLFIAADVNVLPYRKIYQSAVLLMAMSYGLPVIVSNLPANLEVINNRENGLLFETENPDDLAEQISFFFCDPLIKERLSSNGLSTIQTAFSWESIAKQYVKIIE